MSKIVILDAGPLGMVTHPSNIGRNADCQDWLTDLLVQGAIVVVPEITDYEVRRELLRARKGTGIARLDALETRSGLRYLPLTTDMMLLAAQFWAEARQRHSPTADHRELDVDVILAAQAAFVGTDDDEVIIASTNVAHLSLFADAREWRSIR